MSILVVLSGCGKKVVVSVPGSTPAVSASELEGLASYYAEPYHGRRTANGETFDTYRAMTAAHRTLPFNTVVRVKNKNNGREVEVRINDRGPFIDGRVIDLSLIAARELDMVRAGVVPVRLEIVKAGAVQTGRLGTTPLYAVQVGAFENQEAAETLKRELEKRYSGVTVQTVSGQRTLYRVRVGRGEPDIQAAHKLAAQLRREDFDSFVVRVN
ncbi:MAG: septal ring lytic transglycosylase RlpA family protein [Acidobacteria bacterium]|nr:septal ring lytic transglycosylase RlpA family protein [Acidobacteriota bacterium]